MSGNNPYLSTKGLIDVKCNLMNERKNRNNNKLMIPNQHYWVNQSYSCYLVCVKFSKPFEYKMKNSIKRKIQTLTELELPLLIKNNFLVNSYYEIDDGDGIGHGICGGVFDDGGICCWAFIVIVFVKKTTKRNKPRTSTIVITMLFIFSYYDIEVNYWLWFGCMHQKIDF